MPLIASPGHNKTFSVVAMCINNPDHTPFAITADTQPQLHPALLRLSAMISQYFTGFFFNFAGRLYPHKPDTPRRWVIVRRYSFLMSVPHLAH
jgi:hypothetical protein